MAYKHDVFLSYYHEGIIADWVSEHFLPALQLFLNLTLPRQSSIFFDRRDITVGAVWPEVILDNLFRSRCLVSIWTPSYFQSEWCQRETLLMLQRQQKVGLSKDNRATLIYPVTVHGGESFPEYARQFQQYDMRRFFILGQSFRQTEIYVEFRKAVRNIASDVAQGIIGAPEWDEAWLKSPPIEVPEPPPRTFELPTLG